MNTIILGDNLIVLPTLPDKFARMIYIDPNFNTGNKQTGGRLKMTANINGDREGFGGKTYAVEKSTNETSYEDSFDDFPAFLMPRIEAALHCLTDDGSLFVHLDYREVHYIKVALDKLLGRDHFMNEIIWAYDFGGRSKTKWSCKHDTILWYRKGDDYIFNFDEIDRIPYLAPSLVGEEKAERGKTPTDVQWCTICPTAGKERTGYPTQKPLRLLDRFIKVHTRLNDTVLDFFAGSGTTLEAAAKNGRGFVGIDQNPEAVQIMAKRLEQYNPECIGFSKEKQ